MGVREGSRGGGFGLVGSRREEWAGGDQVVEEAHDV